MEKEKKEVKFDPANYDYLENATLKDLVLNFLVRNPEFRQDWDILKDMPSNMKKIEFQNELYKKYKVWITAMRFPPYIKIEIPHSVHVLRFDDNFKIPKDIPPKDLHYYNHRGSDLSKVDAEWILRGLVSNPVGKAEKVLLISINLNATKEEIEAEIKKILEIHKKRKKSSLRSDKWKYYLIVYDLKQQNIDYPEIENILANTYPDREDKFDVENLTNYYKKAKELINGSYKKYILP